MSTSKNDRKSQWDTLVTSDGGGTLVALRETWAYRDLVWMFAKRDLIVLYKQTVLGPLWLLLQPLLLTFVYAAVFHRIGGLSTAGAPAYLFYLTGIIFWGLFASILQQTSLVLRDNYDLFNKVFFPRLAVPIAVVFSSLLRFAIQLAALGVVSLLFFAGSVWVSLWSLLVLGWGIVLIIGISAGFGLLIASLTARYRDLVYVLPFLVQVLLYSTPVIFPMESVPSSLATWVWLNPLASAVETIRYSFLDAGTLNLSFVAYSTVFSFLVERWVSLASHRHRRVSLIRSRVSR